MTARCYAQTELYRVLGEDSLLDMSRKMRQELFAKGRGGMLVTGSCSEGEHFTYNQNAALFQTFPSFRDLTVDPTSIGEPVSDDSVRQGGLKVSARAWTTADCTGDKVSVVFTEFADPSGREVYFKVPDAPAVIPLVDDEIMTL